MEHSMQSDKLTFYHDSDGLDYIEAFQASLKLFGLYLEDLTKENTETLDVRITDIKPEKEFGS